MKLECAAALSDIAECLQNETCVKQATQEHMYTSFHWLNFKDVCRNEIYNNAKNHHFFLYCDLTIWQGTIYTLSSPLTRMYEPLPIA